MIGAIFFVQELKLRYLPSIFALDSWSSQMYFDQFQLLYSANTCFPVIVLQVWPPHGVRAGIREPYRPSLV